LQGSWSDHCNLLKKENKNGTPPWYVKVGGHPKDSVSHGCEKKVGRSAKLYKRARMCQFFKELGTALNLFSMEDNKYPIASR
jgi:hypothetical protein